MKLALYYPGITKRGRRPLWGQNRQFKFAHSDQVRIYPLIPASAASWWAREGHEVLFLDCPNAMIGLEAGRDRLREFHPDLVAMETKAPVLRELQTEIEWGRAAVGGHWVLFGDVASAWPERVLELVGGDWLIEGGDYDASLMGLVRHLDRGGPLPGGVWKMEDGRPVSSGGPTLLENLDEIPLIDRELTGWSHYGEAYLHDPATYILSGRGCGGKSGEGGKCVFCSWQHTLWGGGARLRSPEALVDEILSLRDRLGVKEVFDDNESGMTWDPAWLESFVVAAERKGLSNTLYLSANARADHLTEKTCRLLHRGGFRLLKVGLESANDETLKRIQKGETFQEIDAGIRRAKAAGLRVLMTMMVGYPWEGEEAVRRTYQAARSLLTYKAKFGDCLQASVIVPYPGSPLYDASLQQGWFRVDPGGFSNFDMDQAVLRSPVDAPVWCKRLWRLHLNPLFLAKSLFSLRKADDLALAWRGVRSLMGHVRDYE